VKSIAFDTMGHKMATAGVDGQVKVWDVRTFKPVHSYFSHAPATSLEISQQGLLAVGFGSRVQVRRTPTT
jgi:U3 small nucleolar RNA-associated protein 7